MPVTLFPPELLSGTLVRSQCMHRALCFFPLLTQQRVLICLTISS